MTFRYTDIVKEVSEQTGFSEETVNRVINHQFLFIRNSIYHDFTPRILIHELGSFTMPKHSVEQMIRIAIKEYRQKKITRTVVRKRVKALWKIRTKLKEVELNPQRYKPKQ
jgi:hypothetical protein